MADQVAEVEMGMATTAVEATAVDLAATLEEQAEATAMKRSDQGCR